MVDGMSNAKVTLSLWMALLYFPPWISKNWPKVNSSFKSVFPAITIHWHKWDSPGSSDGSSKLPGSRYTSCDICVIKRIVQLIVVLWTWRKQEKHRGKTHLLWHLLLPQIARHSDLWLEKSLYHFQERLHDIRGDQKRTSWFCRTYSSWKPYCSF